MIETRQSKFKTHISTLDENSITVRGKNLVDDLLGKINIGDLFFLEVVGRMPTAGESAMTNAMMVAISEHGMMPSVIAARMTLLSAPESLQGAVASGLLGVGDRFVGPSSNVAKILQANMPDDEQEWPARAESIVDDFISRNMRIPGLGHPHHPVDPRAEMLLSMQKTLGIADKYTKFMLQIHVCACQALNKHLTFNAVAAVGAIASDLGIDWRAVRGIGLVARTVSLVGHLLEEMNEPQANAMWELVQANSEYSD